MYTIYKSCPVFKNDLVTLRLTREEDAAELLACYSDEQAVPLFNADNCNDAFHYLTVGRLKQAIDFWRYSYESRQFVRMSIFWNPTHEIIGTVEMFNRGVAPGYGVHGILRVDVRSAYEEEEVLLAILQLANEHFYKEFGVEWMMTKAVDAAMKRRKVLADLGYIPMSNFALNHYYGREFPDSAEI